MTDQIRFQVETERVLEILSSEIYDSPLALLRENVQNAYDAILMRCARDNEPLSIGVIEVSISGQEIKIFDNGIGMTEEVLRNNFWKAGSSGKQSDLAHAAGVIGTFGIGAMANFGIATRMQVTTRSSESAATLTSVAERSKLSIAEDCISLDRTSDNRDQGTEVAVLLESEVALTESDAISYLSTYIKYLPIAVKVNSKLISQEVLDTSIPFSTDQLDNIGHETTGDGLFHFNVQVGINKQAQVVAEVTDVEFDGEPANGSLLLSQGGGQLMGYRNYFGLAPIPISSTFQLGGVANLSFLTPTAGREALSRESISNVQRIVSLVENVVAQKIAVSDSADRNPSFQTYIVNHSRYELAGNIRIEVLPERESIKLGRILDHNQGRRVHYYVGRDPAIMRQFASPESALLHISQSNPLRQIQLQYVTQTLGISQIPDTATVTKTYSSSELSVAEAALAIRTASTLADQYFLGNVDVVFADISHGVHFLVEGNQKSLKLTMARKNAGLLPLLECYESVPAVFSDFVTDYVRNQVYPHIRNFVPSSAQGGADALQQVLQSNRELYRYEETDFGELEPILTDFLAGKASLGQAIKRARGHGRSQQQRVSSSQVGTVEAAIPDVVNSPVQPPVESALEPRPAIVREDSECTFKILRTESKYPQLNHFDLFLGLSDRLFRRERAFFKTPHTTRVIWGGHRVIYIFDHAHSDVTLYYDIELRAPLLNQAAGGKMIISTTLLLKNRLFVPVPPELDEEFRVREGEKRFYVNFDTVP